MANPARKEAVAYTVRRPFLFNGSRRLIGSIMRVDEFRHGYAETMVRAGKIDPLYELPKKKFARAKVLPGETVEV